MPKSGSNIVESKEWIERDRFLQGNRGKFKTDIP